MTDDTEFTPQEVRQTAGRSIAFNGRLLASTEFQTRLGKPRSLLLEVWETQGRAYVAVSRSEAIGGPDDSDVRATVVKIGAPDPEFPAIVWVPNELEMRCAVMDHFGWNYRARAMCRKALGWKFVQEIA